MRDSLPASMSSLRIITKKIEIFELTVAQKKVIKDKNSDFFKQSACDTSIYKTTSELPVWTWPLWTGLYIIYRDDIKKKIYFSQWMHDKNDWVLSVVSVLTGKVSWALQRMHINLFWPNAMHIHFIVKQSRVQSSYCHHGSYVFQLFALLPRSLCKHSQQTFREKVKLQQKPWL